ncbi:putative glutamate dehydrogenase [Pantoea ananatis AJ13355]|uniref:Glutamate dehydrogenase n=1 Tax=Pantoea ananatis (strain AJ13355) TaxID=932677 RepID=A0A0H3KST0_PANAA|nr:putative glutamate dehydrogenase [Pantoea ananatis AJ13355]
MILFDFQTCDTASIFGRLTLRIVEVGWNSDNRFSHWLTQEIFSRFLHLFQDFRRNLRRCHFLAFHFQPCVAVIGTHNFVWHDFDITLHFFVLEATADQALNRKQGILRVGDGLTFSRLSDQSFPILGVSDDRRRGAIAFRVFEYARFGAVHDRNTRVGCTQVNTNNLTHLNISHLNSLPVWVVNLLCGQVVYIQPNLTCFFLQRSQRSMTSKWGRLEAHQGLNEKKFSVPVRPGSKTAMNTLTIMRLAALILH